MATWLCRDLALTCTGISCGFSLCFENILNFTEIGSLHRHNLYSFVGRCYAAVDILISYLNMLYRLQSLFSASGIIWGESSRLSAKRHVRTKCNITCGLKVTDNRNRSLNNADTAVTSGAAIAQSV
jgi:hypothetical protein